MRAVTLFFVAGILEIGGGYLVWLWLRERQAALLGVVGFMALALYGVVPVFQSRVSPFGRIYAAYGAIFIAMSLLWGWAIDRQRPDPKDWIGAAVSLIGAVIMMWPRAGVARP